MNWEDIQRERREGPRQKAKAAPELHERPARPPATRAVLPLPFQEPDPAFDEPEPIAPPTEAPPKEKTYWQKRKELAEKRDKEIKDEFAAAKRQVKWLVAAFIAIIAVSSVIGFLASRAEESRRGEELRRLNGLILEGQRVFDHSSPYGALASWRSAWIRRDPKDLLATYSGELMRRTVGDAGREAYRVFLERNMQGDVMKAEIEKAVLFENPQVVYWPDNPRDGDIVLFRSPALVREGIREIPTSWVVAVSFEGTTNQWKFADCREAQYFSVRWTNERMIRPLKGGMNAERFDEDGNPINVAPLPRGP